MITGNRLNGLAYEWEIGNPFSQETGKYSITPTFYKIFLKFFVYSHFLSCLQKKYICFAEESITILRVLYIVYFYSLFFLATLAYHQVQTYYFNARGVRFGWKRSKRAVK